MRSPDKSIDVRPESLSSVATFQELVTTAQDFFASDGEAGLMLLQDTWEPLVGSAVTIPDSTSYVGYPNGRCERSDGVAWGIFKGLVVVDPTDINIIQKDENKHHVPPEKPFLAMQIDTTKKEKTKSGILSFEYPVVLLTDLSTVDSLDIFSPQQLGSLLNYNESNKWTIDIAHKALVDRIRCIQNRYLNGLPIDDLYLSRREKWDYTPTGRTPTISTLRNVKADFLASSAIVAYMDPAAKVPVFNHTDWLSFSGFYWGVTNFNPAAEANSGAQYFTLEMYGTSHTEIADDVSILDKRTNRPLVYVPIDGEIMLDFC